MKKFLFYVKYPLTFGGKCAIIKFQNNYYKGGENMKSNQAYLNEYIKKHYKRIELKLKPELVDKIKADAKANGKSVTQYIVEKINK